LTSLEGKQEPKKPKERWDTIPKKEGIFKKNGLEQQAEKTAYQGIREND